YGELVQENRARGRHQSEFELLQAGVFDDNRYFDVFVEYAKASPDDVLILITIQNRGADASPLHVLPTLWFRNTWSWGRQGEGYSARPEMRRVDRATLEAHMAELGTMRLHFEPVDDGPELLFTENETNAERLFGVASASRYTKDAFHDYVVSGKK